MSLNHLLCLDNLMQWVLFLDCKEIGAPVVELRPVQAAQLGMAELGFPTCPLSSPAPRWCSGSRSSVSPHSTSPPAEAGCRGFQSGDVTLPCQAGQDQPGRRVSGQYVHSGAALVEKLECCPTTLEILQPAWKLPQPLLAALS